MAHFALRLFTKKIRKSVGESRRVFRTILRGQLSVKGTQAGESHGIEARISTTRTVRSIVIKRQGRFSGDNGILTIGVSLGARNLQKVFEMRAVGNRTFDRVVFQTQGSYSERNSVMQRMVPVLSVALCLVSNVKAELITYEAALDGPSELTPSGSPGTGFAERAATSIPLTSSCGKSREGT
jgi:hypothetical protein